MTTGKHKFQNLNTWEWWWMPS